MRMTLARQEPLHQSSSLDLFVANVCDYTTVLGEVNPKAGEPEQHAMIPRALTLDHKAKDPVEARWVEKLGKPSVCVCVCVITEQPKFL